MLFVFLGILITFGAQAVMAQEQKADNIREINEINRNLERIYRHLDDDATQTEDYYHFDDRTLSFGKLSFDLLKRQK